MLTVCLKLDGKDLLDLGHLWPNACAMFAIPGPGDLIRLRARNAESFDEYRVLRIVHPFSYFPGVNCLAEPVEVHVERISAASPGAR